MIAFQPTLRTMFLDWLYGIDRSPPKSTPTVAAPPQWTLDDERRAALAFIADPTLFWLDPNFWGEFPDWRDKLFNRIEDDEPDEPEPAQADAPPCPVCKTGRRLVLAIHGGEATMWDCVDCGAEFTRAGETKASRAARRKKYCGCGAAMPHHPGECEDAKRKHANIFQPKMIFRSGYTLPCGCIGTGADVEYIEYGGWAGDSGWSTCKLCGSKWVAHTGNPLVDEGRSGVVRPPLPCGCAYETPIEHTQSPGLRYSRCKSCDREWEPPSNDSSGRKLGQGETVQKRGHIRRNHAWQRRADAVHAGTAENHGSCPEPCGMPVDKCGGYYYCSDSQCEWHKKGWR